MFQNQLVQRSICQDIKSLFYYSNLQIYFTSSESCLLDEFRRDLNN